MDSLAEGIASLVPARRDPGVPRPERIRQSHIARYDMCPLSLRFDLETNLRQASGTMGILGARGVLFHRFAARGLDHMREHGETGIGVDMAMEYLTEILAQQDVPADEVVHLPMREVKWLRVLATRWAEIQTFRTDRIVDVEQRLNADLDVIGEGGRRYFRTVTGKPDVLIAGPGAEEATIVDWKSGWAPPSRPTTRNGETKPGKLSDMGYVQQIVYGWLVLRNFPSVQQVTLREWYVMEDVDPVRVSTIERYNIERIEDALRLQVSQIDAAIRAGKYSERWFPVPGSHCSTCANVRGCPVRKHLRLPATLEEVQIVVREWLVAAEVRSTVGDFLRGWVDAHGPIPIAHAKGRREVGWVPNKTGTGRSFKLYEPAEAPESPYDPLLEEAARKAGVLAE